MRRYRITRSDALQAIDHNALARLQTGLDHPAALLVRAQANFAVSRLVAVVDHDNEALVLIRAYRLLIDQNGVARGPATQAYARIQAGNQGTAGIVEGSLQIGSAHI